MTFEMGIGLFFLGMIVTVLAMIVLIKAMEHQDKDEE
jgi:hypothetical protein